MIKPLSQNPAANRLPANALFVRVPPRRIETAQAENLQYGFFVREAGRVVNQGFSRLPDLVRAGETVLLLAAEDVLLTDATVPPLSSGRLRDALPNLIEDRTLTDVSRLHVAQISTSAQTRSQTLAAVDRAWLTRVLDRFKSAGHRVRWVLPESLCVPFVSDSWTLAGLPGTLFCVRTGPDQALALPHDPESAALLLQALIEKANVKPSTLKVYAAPEQMPDVMRVVHALPQSLAQSSVATQTVAHDPIHQFLNRPDFEAHPQTLLQHEFARSLFDASQWQTWRRVAILVGALLAVQIIGMQIHWAQLRAERAELREQSASLLRTAFPATTTILDAPLQMERGLAELRANAGQGNPGDFTALVSAVGQIFADAPANSFRGLEYGSSKADRSLRIRLTQAVAGSTEQQVGWTQRAAAAGYDLRFENAFEPGSPVQIATPNRNPGEITASLRAKGAS